VRLPGREAIRLEVEDLADAVDIPSGNAAYVPVPLVGQIAAGVRNLADQVIEDTFVLPRQLVGDGTLFLLRVHGESMINAAIADGDLVVVRQQEKAENGDIVAAMIDGEATVKTFRRAKGHIWLMPHNPAYTPIPGDDATILGKVVTVLRRV
jgi:repressor LexA